MKSSNQWKVASRREAWIEIKDAECREERDLGSLSQRGVNWNSEERKPTQVWNVASRREAWIEIINTTRRIYMQKVASRREAWIEMCRKQIQADAQKCSLSQRGVNWNRAWDPKNRSKVVASRREAWIEIRNDIGLTQRNLVASRREAWIEILPPILQSAAITCSLSQRGVNWNNEQGDTYGYSYRSLLQRDVNWNKSRLVRSLQP